MLLVQLTKIVITPCIICALFSWIWYQ